MDWTIIVQNTVSITALGLMTGGLLLLRSRLYRYARRQRSQ